MTSTETPDDAQGRFAVLEERVARLESALAHGAAGARVDRPEESGGDIETFWALEELKRRVPQPGAVLFTGSVTLPTGEHYEWQQAHAAQELLADDWGQAGTALTALAHPVRLLLLQEILNGARTTSALSAHERLGTTGQLYHHLRQLVAGGWLRTTARGHYSVPAERVVALLVVLATARR